MAPGASHYLWQAVAIGLLLLPLAIAILYAFVWRGVLAKPVAFVLIGAACLFLLYVVVGELLFVPTFHAVFL